MHSEYIAPSFINYMQPYAYICTATISDCLKFTYVTICIPVKHLHSKESFVCIPIENFSIIIYFLMATDQENPLQTWQRSISFTFFKLQ